MKQDIQPWQQLRMWYQTELGAVVAQTVQLQLDDLLGELFGYHLCQLGLSEHTPWLNTSPINFRIRCDVEETSAANVLWDGQRLPVRGDCIDLCYLPHTLELSSKPQQLLSNIEYSLVPEGHILILGFNPFSLWGLRRCLSGRDAAAPWRGYFHSPSKLRRQLLKLGIHTKSVTYFFYRPPSSDPYWLKRLLFLETLGQLSLPYPAGMYLLLGQKTVNHVQAIKPSWQFKKNIAKSFVQPTTRCLRTTQ